MKPETNQPSETFNKFIKENASNMFGIDNRLMATLKQLLFRPGQLSKAYLLEGANRYTVPTTLYFSINLLFFLLLPIINSGDIKILSFRYQGFVAVDGFHKRIIEKDLASSELSEVVYKAQFDSFITYNQPALIFVMIPFFILLVRLMNLKVNKKILQHTIFSFHFMSFFLIAFLFLGAFTNLISMLIILITGEPFYAINPISLLLFILSVLGYIAKSLMVVYDDSLVFGLLKSLFLTVGLFALFYGYMNFLFFLAMFSV